MTAPPVWLRFRLADERYRLSLWLPLFIIWPFAIMFALVLLPFVLLFAAVFWCSGYGKTLLQSGPRIMSCICALRGLNVDVGQGKERFLISIR
jgi:hypothetical protein